MHWPTDRALSLAIANRMRSQSFRDPENLQIDVLRQKCKRYLRQLASARLVVVDNFFLLPNLAFSHSGHLKRMLRYTGVGGLSEW